MSPGKKKMSVTIMQQTTVLFNKLHAEDNKCSKPFNKQVKTMCYPKFTPMTLT